MMWVGVDVGVVNMSSDRSKHMNTTRILPKSYMRVRADAESRANCEHMRNK